MRVAADIVWCEPLCRDCCYFGIGHLQEKVSEGCYGKSTKHCDAESKAGT